MTISTTTRKAGPFPGDGIAVSFPFTFKVFTAADLFVVRTDSIGTETELVLGADYSVTLNGNQNLSPGGSVVLAAALAVGLNVTVASDLPLTQPVELSNAGGFYPRVINDALDRLTILLQQVAEKATRSLKLAISTPPGVSTELPAPAAYKILGWNPTGTAIINVDATGQAQLADALADDGIGTAGPALVAFNPALDYADGTVGGALRRGLALSQFVGADASGVGDSTAAYNVALSVAVALRAPYLMIDGRFRYTSQITVPAKVALRGAGWTSDSAIGSRAYSCLIKDFNGLGHLFSGDDASSDGVHFDSVTGRTGDVVQVTGSRVRLLNGASTNGGQDGVRVGKTEAGPSSINANCGVLMNWISLNNGRHGVHFDHTNTSTGGTYPLGAPDVNAWTVSHLIVGATGQHNGGDGLRIGNAIDSVFSNVVSQDNTGNSVRLTTGARGHRLTVYSEGNDAGGPLFDAGATNNDLQVLNYLITGQDPVDNDGGNRIDRAVVSIPGPFFNWLKVANLAPGGAADVSLYAGENSVEAVKIRGTNPTSSRGRLTLQTKNLGGALTDRMVLDEALCSLPSVGVGLVIGKAVADTTTPGVQIMDGATARVNLVNSGTGATTVAAFYNGGGQVGSISTSGAATTYATSSDHRLKTAVSYADPAAALEAVMSWPIRSFIWKATGAADVGVIAHELQEVKPSAVTGTKDGPETQGVDYSKLVPELVAAVQCLAERVAALETGVK